MHCFVVHRHYRVASGGSSPRVCRGDSVVLPDLVGPSLSGSTRAVFPLVVGWSTKRQVDVAVEGLVRRDVLLYSRNVTEEGATMVADDFRDRRQASSRCALVISDELLPADLQQLSLTLHMQWLRHSYSKIPVKMLNKTV